MKIGVITYHRAINYGAVLQTYALQEALRKLDVNSEKGKSMIEKVKHEFYIEKCNIDEGKIAQPNLRRPTYPNKNRNKFFKLFNKYGYKIACFRVVTIQKIIDKPKKILKKIRK